MRTKKNVMTMALNNLSTQEPSYESWNNDNEEDINWKAHIPKELWKYGDVFSKRKSERMPTRKLYDHAIELVKDTEMPQPAKVISLLFKER